MGITMHMQYKKMAETQMKMMQNEMSTMLMLNTASAETAK